jgi:predicted permease
LAAPVENPISILWPIFYVFIFAIMYTLCAVAGRITIPALKISSIQYTADAFFMVSLFFIGMGLHHHLAVEPYPTVVLIASPCAGFCLMVAISLFHEACTYGKGGPAMALSQF